MAARDRSATAVEPRETRRERLRRLRSPVAQRQSARVWVGPHRLVVAAILDGNARAPARIRKNAMCGFSSSPWWFVASADRPARRATSRVDSPRASRLNRGRHRTTDPESKAARPGRVAPQRWSSRRPDERVPRCTDRRDDLPEQRRERPRLQAYQGWRGRERGILRFTDEPAPAVFLHPEILTSRDPVALYVRRLEDRTRPGTRRKRQPGRRPVIRDPLPRTGDPGSGTAAANFGRSDFERAGRPSEP